MSIHAEDYLKDVCPFVKILIVTCFLGSFVSAFQLDITPTKSKIFFLILEYVLLKWVRDIFKLFEDANYDLT